MRILFSDLDGTLLDDNKKLSAENIQAAGKALAAGKYIIINSGRSWHSLSFFEEQLGLNKPGNIGSGFNGGVVYEYASDGIKRRVLSENVLANAKGLQIAARLKELGTDVLVYTLNDLYAEGETEYNKSYRELSNISLHIIDDFAMIKNGIIKILAQGAYEDLRKLQTEMASVCGDEVYTVFSCPWLLEFGPPAAHKGNSVKLAASRLGVPLNEIIAMGDEENDIAMLKTAGLGIAVANATPDTKAAARIVLPYTNNQSAFARVVEEYLL